MSSMEISLFNSSAHLLIRLVVLMFSYMRHLYSFDINPLLVISFANIFSHLVGCVFALSVVPFAMQKLQVQLDPIGLFLLLFV